MASRVGVIVPMKPFTAAKGRLASTLTPGERARLAKEMAQTVLDAARPLPTLVVCNHTEVADWAKARGALVLWQQKEGLNNAVQEAFDHLRDAGFTQIIIAHGDLPFAKALAWVAEFEGVTIVPDRHQSGTNVLSVPATTNFVFGYGPNSFHYHLEHARALGVPYRVVNDVDLGWDIDEPRDLAALSTPTDTDCDLPK